MSQARPSRRDCFKGGSKGELELNGKNGEGRESCQTEERVYMKGQRQEVPSKNCTKLCGAGAWWARRKAAEDGAEKIDEWGQMIRGLIYHFKELKMCSRTIGVINGFLNEECHYIACSFVYYSRIVIACL